MDALWIVAILVIGLGIYAFNVSTRTEWRDRGNGDELDLRTPGEPGNRGDTDMTGHL